MLQEIITFAIVAAAVSVTVYKFYQQFRKRKPKPVNYNDVSMAETHNCSDCAAKCILRDMPKQTIAKSAKVCDTNYIEK